jgi:hypothetical protein
MVVLGVCGVVVMEQVTRGSGCDMGKGVVLLAAMAVVRCKGGMGRW